VRNSKTQPLAWKITRNLPLANAVQIHGWEVSWVFTSLIAFVDTYGRTTGSMLTLRDEFFPHHPGVTPSELERWISALAEAGLVIRYQVDNLWYVQLPKIGNYRTAGGNKASESDYPEPPSNNISEWETRFGDEYRPFILKSPVREKGDPKYIEVLEYWNASGLPNARHLTRERTEKLKLRWREPEFKQNYKVATKKIASSGFCRGKSKNGWKATFDWFIRNDNNWLKAYEGKYDDSIERTARQYFLGND